MTRNLLSLTLFILISACGFPACTPTASTSPSIRIRWAADPQTLDVLLANTPQALEVINLLHCSLLVGDPANRTPKPWLAQALPTVSRRGHLTRLTYLLRPEATWDNGQPVLATDVAFTLKVLNCPGLPTEYARTQYGFVTDIELDSTNARRFTLVCQSSSPDIFLASGDYAILPEYALDPAGQLRDVPLALLHTDTLAAIRRFPALRQVAARYRSLRTGKQPGKLPGCGPYTLVSWQKGRSLKLRRKKNWWATRLPHAPRWLQAHARQLAYEIIPDNATALLALRRGDLDLYPQPAARDFSRLRHSADTARLAFYTADSYDMTMVGFNTQHRFLANAPTRRALRTLFDVPGLMQATQQGLAYRSVGLINPHDKPAYLDSLPLIQFSLAEASQRLRQAGWQRRADGWWRQQQGPLNLTMSYRAEEPEHETVALQFRAAAAKLDIPVRLRPTEEGELRRQLVAGKVGMYVRTVYGSPFGYNMGPMLHSRNIGISNLPRFRSAPADRLMDDIVREANPARRTQLLRRFQRLMDEQSPLSVLYFTQYRLIASRRLQPVRAISMRPGYDVLSLELASRATP